MNGLAEPLLSEAVWVLGAGSGKVVDWVRGQIDTLVPQLCGTQARFATQLEGAFCIVMGSPGTNRWPKRLGF